MTVRLLRCNFLQGECRKKTARSQSDERHSLEAFHHRLRDLCEHYGKGDGSGRAQIEAECARALAGELQILRKSDRTFAALKAADQELRIGTEHLVEFDSEVGRVLKITVPPAFGLIPKVISTPRANLRNDPSIPLFRQQIEFIHATPLKYLERWIAANDLFGDDVRLNAMVEWSDGQLSCHQPAAIPWRACDHAGD